MKHVLICANREELTLLSALAWTTLQRVSKRGTEAMWAVNGNPCNVTSNDIPSAFARLYLSGPRPHHKKIKALN